MEPTIDEADFSLEIRETPDGSPTTVCVAGAVDMTTAEELDSTVRDQMGRGPVLLDLSAVSFMDSSGLRALDGLVRHSRTGGGELHVAATIPDSVAQILDLTGIMATLPLTDAG